MLFPQAPFPTPIQDAPLPDGPQLRPDTPARGGWNIDKIPIPVGHNLTPHSQIWQSLSQLYRR